MRSAVTLSLVCLAAGAARAEGTCPLPKDAAPALASAAPEQRLAFIEGTLDGQARASEIWAWIWGVGESALVVYNVTDAVLVVGEPARANAVVGAAAAIIPPALILALPPKAIADRRAVAAAVLRSGPSCETLTLAEAALARDADDEAFATSWVVHVGVVAVTAAAALVLGLGYGSWVDAAITGGAVFVLGEGQTWTHPRGAIEAERRYLAGDLGAPPPSPRVAWGVVPFVGRGAFGAMLTLAE
ncbi:MAG TPA: hypothetical protein VMB50_19455 [Myxococcales bacterium]|nr:hypothetical protein [Myxococcales bacterium]